MPHHMSPTVRECIEACQSCQQICLESVNHCLERGGKHAEADHIRMLLACAEICATSARLMLLGSPHHPRVCDVCAEVCAACAEDCSRFDDEMMTRCADACRRCAESCREMASMETHG